VKTYTSDVQSELDRAIAALAAHGLELMRVPGVHGVSVEPKTIKGIRTPEFALVAHVVRKRPLTELTPEEVIPTTIDGVSTDVVEAAPIVASANPPADSDSSHYSPVVGGGAIASDSLQKSIHDNSSGTAGAVKLISGAGTLGCIAINTTATDPSKKAVALTNAHVLLDVAISTTKTGAAVGQPDTSSLCCKSLDHTIGHIDHDVQLIGSVPSTNPPSGIDAGFATLDPGVQWSAAVIATGEGGTITTEPVAGPYLVKTTDALFDTSNPPKPIYPVHKRGARTRNTTGWLTSITNLFSVIYPSLDGSVSKTVVLANQLKVICQDSTSYFSDHGDSGSVVLNSSHQVIGLHSGGSRGPTPATSYSSECPIAAVQTVLGVVIADNATYPGVQTVPKAAAAAAAFAILPASQKVLRQRMEVARAELTSTEVGQEMDAALHRHFGEIRGLVNVNKRAAAVWRRVAGPAWIGEALSCMMDRYRRFPNELEGRRLNDCLDQFAQVLQRYGSQSLVADAQRWEPAIRAFAGRTYDDVLVAFRERMAAYGRV
jgi:hypothetical protein